MLNLLGLKEEPNIYKNVLIDLKASNISFSLPQTKIFNGEKSS